MPADARGSEEATPQPPALPSPKQPQGSDPQGGPTPNNPAELTTATAAAQPVTPAASWGLVETVDAAADKLASVNVSGIAFGSYEIIQEIARGGMGIVFLAKHLTLQRLVALKIMRPGAGDLSDRARRFDREARAAAQLSHPNIVPVLDHGVFAGQHYYTMALMAGGTLDQKRDSVAAEPRQAVQLMEKVARAVAHAHERNVLHRDLKPSNILLDEHSEPRVSDFGLAKMTDSETQVTIGGAMLGTPAYMPPEQTSGISNLIGPSSDVWSLGVILYELLAGRRPFQAQSNDEVHRQIREDDPVQPKKLRPGLDIDLQTIALKCLEKDPSRRYATAAELADDLGRWLRGEPIRARRIGRLQRAWRWCRRRPQLTCVTGIVLASLLAAGAGAYMALQAERARRSIVSQPQAAQESDEHARLLYNGAFARVLGAWAKGDIRAVRQGLDALKPADGTVDRRGFEWHYLQHLCDNNLGMLDNGPVEVADMAYSPQGGQLACAGRDGTIRVWDLASAKVVKSFKAHERRTMALVFHPDGKRIASAGADGKVKIWEASTGQLIRALPLPVCEDVAIAFSAAGDRLAFAGGVHLHQPSVGHLLVWNTATWTPTVTPLREPRSFLCIAFSPDGRRLAAGSVDRSVHLWDSAGTRIATLSGHNDWIRCAVFSHDGRLLASGSDDHTIRLWEMSALGGSRVLSGHTKGVTSLAFARDDQELASGSFDESVRLWDVKSAWNQLTFQGHTSTIVAIAFAPDGFPLASAGEGGRVIFWDPNARQDCEMVRTSKGSVLSLAIAANGSLAFGQDVQISIWDPDAGRMSRVLGPLRYSANSLAYSPDGKSMAAGDGDGLLMMFDPATGLRKWGFPAHDRVVTGLEYSPNGKLLASGSFDGTLKFWDSSSGALLGVLGETRHSIYGIAFSSNGRWLAEANFDNTATIWDVASRRPLRTLRGHEQPVHAVAFGAGDGILATGGMDGAVKLWNPQTGELIRTIMVDRAGVRTLAFSPDGNRLACGGWQGTVHVLDPFVGQELMTLSAHTGPAFGLGFSRDGQRLVSGSTDGMLAIWEAAQVDAEQVQRRFARGLVRELSSRSLPRMEVLRLIREKPGLSEAVRRKAIELMNGPAPAR